MARQNPSRYPLSPAGVRTTGFKCLSFLNHLNPILHITSQSLLCAHFHSVNNVVQRTGVAKTTQRRIVTAKIRRLHPTLLPSLLPVVPTVRQFRRDFGPPSTALDRILISVLVLGLLHLFPTSRILLLARLLALLWPMLHPLLIGSRRNAQLRFSANQSPPLIVAGKLQVCNTNRGTVVRVSDGSRSSKYPKPLLTTSNANRYDGDHACALVVGGRVIDVAVGDIYLAPYPCVQHRVLNEVCTAIYAEA